MKTYKDFSSEAFEASIVNFKYQEELTKKLEGYDFDIINQEIINELVLWKVNRFCKIDDGFISLLSKAKTIQRNEYDVIESLVSEILDLRTQIKGFDLPMLSSFLRFINPNTFQIIDKRAYRFAFGHEENYSNKTNDKKAFIYRKYLETISNIAKEKHLSFNLMDRYLYQMDKENNKGLNIYSKK